MNAIEKISRRRFLEMTGISSAGLLLMGVVPSIAGVLAEAEGASLNLFVSVKPDGSVEIIAHRSEMGTGIRTSLPQVVADEMEADWARVTVIQGLGNPAYGSQDTDGSCSIRDFYLIMRQMGAAARRMLEQAAAQRWAVQLSQCKARDHAVHCSDGRSLGFGELAAAASRQAIPDMSELPLKPAAQFNYIGKDVAIVDLEDMTTGNTTFGIDVVLPGMVYASIERTPVLGGTVKSYDDKAARTVDGVIDVVEIKGQPLPASFHALPGVAVIAGSSYAAMKGREALSVEWNLGENASHNSASYLDELQERVIHPGEVFRQRGDVGKALAVATNKVQAAYRTPYLAHAPMEPPMSTARLSDGGCEVWTCTQNPQAVQQVVGGALGLKPDQVKVHVTLLGGGFGRKSKPDYSAESALLARDIGRPVQVTWTREDDIHHDYYHSCSAQFFQAGLDKSGKVVAWLAREAAPPISATFQLGANEMPDQGLSMTFGSIPFAIPNLQLERHKADAHVRIGWLRSVYNIPYAFGVGSFVDELAHAAGRDPRDFWLELIGPDRHIDFAADGFKFSNHGQSLEVFPYDTARLKNVITLLADSIGWGQKLPPGQGWGIAAARSFLSYVAVACKVEVEGDQLRVTEMHTVMDCGTVINPDRVHAQLEGAMIFGLSLALMGEITFENGAAVQTNFHDYPVARISQTPAVIKTHIVPSDAPPAGVGEPGVPAVAPSIANAVFAATGQRVRELPLNKFFRV